MLTRFTYTPYQTPSEGCRMPDLLRSLRSPVALLWFAGLTLHAQNPTATLLGTVTDAHGALVPGAALEIRNVDTNGLRKTLSDRNGEFTVPNLPPGAYEATIIKEGFRPRRETNIVLVVDQVARVEFQLEVGQISQSVEVTAT